MQYACGISYSVCRSLGLMSDIVITTTHFQIIQYLNQINEFEIQHCLTLTVLVGILVSKYTCSTVARIA